MVQGKLPVPGRPTIWILVEQGPLALAVGAGVGCLDIFTLLCLFSPLSPTLWETARYRLKYCLKGPLNQKQPTYQIIHQVAIKFMFRNTLRKKCFHSDIIFSHNAADKNLKTPFEVYDIYILF